MDVVVKTPIDKLGTVINDLKRPWDRVALNQAGVAENDASSVSAPQETSCEQ